MHRLRRKLPNDLIMHIIKLADGGKYTHKVKMAGVLTNIKNRSGNFKMANIKLLSNWQTGKACQQKPLPIDYTLINQ